MCLSTRLTERLSRSGCGVDPAAASITPFLITWLALTVSKPDA
jgi:hypothetical protein